MILAAKPQKNKYRWFKVEGFGGGGLVGKWWTVVVIVIVVVVSGVTNEFTCNTPQDVP